MESKNLYYKNVSLVLPCGCDYAGDGIRKEADSQVCNSAGAWPAAVRYVMSQNVEQLLVAKSFFPKFTPNCNCIPRKFIVY